MSTPPNTPPPGSAGGPDYAYEPGMLGSSQDNYDPGAVQNVLTEFFQSHKGPMTDYESFLVMYLMQEYGAQVAGCDALLQNKMNSYFGDIQNIWNILYQADNSSNSGDTSLDQQFLNACQGIVNQLKNDPFFKNNPDRESMMAQMTGTLNGIESFVTNPPSGIPSDESVLYYMWSQYDPGLGGGAITGQGNPTQMDNLMRELTQLNSQFTGESQAVAADTKSDVKLYQTEQDVFSNFAKKLTECNSYIQKQQRTQ